MNKDLEEFVFLPSPKSFIIHGKTSHILSNDLRLLNSTREQLDNLPESISLVRSQNQSRREYYSLSVKEEVIQIEASNEQGWHLGILTLKQLALGSPFYLPQCEIEDFPDFEHRGIMLDISRNKVPTRGTLYYLIDLFADWKINQVQLYIEHTFAYPGHEIVWQEASALTPTEIQNLDTYCRERFIELVPNLNCFGHMTRWLVYDKYRPLAEHPNGGETDFGYREKPQGLCAIDPGSIALARELIQGMIPHFQSEQVNVGCDETIDLGYGRSREVVEEKGRGRVYMDYLKQVHQICEDNDRTMQFWADIVLKYPELIGEVPKDCIALNWGYESIHPFEVETAQLQASGIPYYVCPGTSSWHSIGGRTENMIQNINSAAHWGRTNGAMGMMTADWGDSGHLQPLLASFPGYVLGAAQAWNFQENFPLSKALDMFAFKSTGWGNLLLEIGNLDTPAGIYIHNCSILFKLLQGDSETLKARDDLDLKDLMKIRHLAEKLSIEKVRLSTSHPIDPLFDQEFAWVIDMLKHGCERGIQILKNFPAVDLHAKACVLRDTHKQLWRARNRPGGYDDSRDCFRVLTNG
ncbi:MAG: family 20 glycosylhydrolase [Verrucomicrobia bacterium]|nr:family 20 glycosylhydrolase [Verrucomicrobiota bacterium]MDA1068678.1 family 20 glycosylhydrolase [Verrucomicrobiota bacterium]